MSGERDDFDDCDHMDAAIDILTGRLTCDCGYTKWLGEAEYKSRMEFQQRAQQAWDEYCAKVEAEDIPPAPAPTPGRKE